MESEKFVLVYRQNIETLVIKILVKRFSPNFSQIYFDFNNNKKILLFPI